MGDPRAEAALRVLGTDSLGAEGQTERGRVMGSRASRSSPGAFAVMLLVLLTALALAACGSAGRTATSSPSTLGSPSEAAVTPAPSPELEPDDVSGADHRRQARG